MFSINPKSFSFNGITNREFVFSEPGVRKVRSIIENPLAQYDPFFVGKAVHALARTCGDFPRQERIDYLQSEISGLSPLNENYRSMERELADLYYLRATIYRATLIALGVPMATPDSIDYNPLFMTNAYSRMLTQASLFFPQDWIEVSNVTLPVLTVRGNRYLHPEYDTRTGKGRINYDVASLNDFVSVLAMRVFDTNDELRVEVDRLIRSSDNYLARISARDLFAMSLMETVCGKFSNRNNPMIEGYKTYFTLWLMSRHSTLVDVD